MDFSTTLLREKFTLKDSREGNEPIIALSNRVSIALPDTRGRIAEVFVVRSQTMYTCIRMAAKIAQTFFRQGPLMPRDPKFDFQEAWADIIFDHERQFNPKCWVAVYNGGKRIFHANEYHAFFDLIENCDVKNASGNYDTTVFLAEEIFASNGKNISIEQESHTGMVLDVKKKKARCGLILRSPVRRTNFSFVAETEDEKENPINIAQCLNIGASFLEGAHLAFLIGRTNELLRLNQITKYGEDDKKAASARRRMARLNSDIKLFEKKFNASYRPERPEFPSVVVEAEQYTRDLWERKQAEDALAAEQEKYPD